MASADRPRIVLAIALELRWPGPGADLRVEDGRGHLTWETWMMPCRRSVHGY